jgi:hypothetical protein
MSAVHLEQDGRPRCGTPWPVAVTADENEATCTFCLNLARGTHHVGTSRLDLKPCGTLAAYRRHHRRGERVCESCRQAHNRDKADRYAARKQAAA